MGKITKNTLFYGDNLDILRAYIDDESIDLIYLDPPFNSNRSYNVLFKDESGSDSEAQITAFDDSWHWGESAEETYYELTNSSSPEIATMIGALRQFIGTNQMMAYLVMMTIRLKELFRVLKPTGNLFLHCDPTASHYLKIILDVIFGPNNFRNEIIWRRTGAHSSVRSFGSIHDTILYYSKSNNYYFHVVNLPYMKGHVESRYSKDEFGRYKFTSGGNVLTGPGITKDGDSGKEWRGYDPTIKNRHWAIPGFLSEDFTEELKNLSVLDKLEFLYQKGLIEVDKNKAWPTPVRYLDIENSGQPIQDIWAYQPYTKGTVFQSEEGIDSDVIWLGPTSPERLGYQTQKPLGLLERIIKSACPPDGIIFDPFSGCGTSIAASQNLNRQWIGIDITYLAIAHHKNRLKFMFELDPKKDYDVIGDPKSPHDAKQLAHDNRFQFEWWALSLIEARPAGGKKKGSDKGIDGIITFTDEAKGKVKQVLVQVKSGHVKSGLIRDFRGTIERESNAVMGIFITLEKPTRDMEKEALEAGYYVSPFTGQKHSKIQILTIENLLDEREPDLPVSASFSTFKKAEKAIKENKDKQGKLSL